MSDVIKHTGTKRHSGRYPWGSGKNPQRSLTFLQDVHALEKQGVKEKVIADGYNLKINQLRAAKTIARNIKIEDKRRQIMKLKDKGYSNMEISRRTGYPEPTIRSFLDPIVQQRNDILKNVAGMLKDDVDKYKYTDVGLGIENQIGVSRTKLKVAIAMLEPEGYRTHKFDIPQLGTGKNTNMIVLTKNDVSYPEVLNNIDKIHVINHYTEDGGRSILGLEPIRSIDSKKIKIRYNEEGGALKDGVIEIRPGVPELSLGAKHYAQVRIGVDGTHYMKGMAMYNDDIPKGFDVIYNTNKHQGTPKEKVFKGNENDPDNPFGSTVRQKHYIDKDGKEQLSALNTVGYKEGSGEEGSWDKWTKTLSSQVLAKQSTELAKQQLGLTYAEKKDTFDEIMSYTNPVVKKKLLESFADDCDSASVKLKAAALPRQRAQVLLPITSMKENEIYAPNFNNGERVVLIRHPHGGIFEIPELTVNNKQPEAKHLFSLNKEAGNDAQDAVGINAKVAERLSGADFDGDAVLVIPNKDKHIQIGSALKGLKNFDPKESYPPYDKMVTVDGGIWNAETQKVDFQGKRPKTQNKQTQMGQISNLITDMTIQGADTDEIAKAVRHSMVVIDSEKHHLDYKSSYNDNSIASLKKKYQAKPNGEAGGAATLLSRAKSKELVPYREAGKKVLNPLTGKTKRVYVDPETGKKLYEYGGKNATYSLYKDASTGKPYSLKGVSQKEKEKLLKEGVIKEEIIKKTVQSTKMAEVEDAFALSSGTRMETVYANHANQLKALANTARKEALQVPPMRVSPSAKETYKAEVDTLKANLNIAQKNKPLERQAQALGNMAVREKKANSFIDKADLKKISNMTLTEMRTRVGAKKKAIEITDKQWEAIQAGAVTTNVLNQILSNTDLDRIKQLATPRTKLTMTPNKTAHARALLASGHTQAEVALALGVSVTTLKKALE
jgi:hypothetical protein